MKSLTVMATLFSVTGLGAMIPRVTSSSLNITEFAAGCISYGSCVLRFNVDLTPGTNSVLCESSLFEPDHLDMSFTGCTNPIVSWHFGLNSYSDELSLNITTVTAGRNITGSYVVPHEDFVRVINSVQNALLYTGPGMFTITAF
ncbi:hypothetical protein BJ170DRAFT_686005 [Xylariales sp. AK1849]|nr:hypothetical protein BJ170DRAFT_686005 [Xylariales sp. AK1849]